MAVVLLSTVSVIHWALPARVRIPFESLLDLEMLSSVSPFFCSIAIHRASKKKENRVLKCIITSMQPDHLVVASNKMCKKITYQLQGSNLRPRKDPDLNRAP